MKNFFLEWFMRLGYRVEKALMWALPGRGSRGELSSLARWTRLTFREKPETYGGGKKLDMLFTSDINPNSGKAYADYLERREKRKKEEGGERRCAVYEDWKE